MGKTKYKVCYEFEKGSDSKYFFNKLDFMIRSGEFGNINPTTSVEVIEDG